MTKKILLLAVVCVMIALAFTSCAHEHSFGEWETTKNASCTEGGTKVRYCSCGEKQEVSTEKTGHIFGEWETTKNPSCTEDGTKVRYCSCGYNEVEFIERLTPEEISGAEFKDILAEMYDTHKSAPAMKASITVGYQAKEMILLQENGVKTAYVKTIYSGDVQEEWFFIQDGSYISATKGLPTNNTYSTDFTYQIVTQSEYETFIDYYFSDFDGIFQALMMMSEQASSVSAECRGDKIEYTMLVNNSEQYGSGTIKIVAKGNVAELLDMTGMPSLRLPVQLAYGEGVNIPPINLDEFEQK